jgi:hypothetical protein
MEKDNKFMENKFMDWASHSNRIIIERRNKTREDDCVVCLDTLFNKKVAYLPCKHSFHYECLKLTIESKKYTCPLCRYDLIYPLKQLGYTLVEEQEEPMPNLLGLEEFGTYGIGSMRIIHEAEVINHYDYFFYEDEMEAHYVDEHEPTNEQGPTTEQGPIAYEDDEGDDIDDDLDSRMFIARYVIRYI